MKVFLDTNVILDLILRRSGWQDIAKILQAASDDTSIYLEMSILSVANIAYILRKQPRNIIIGIIRDISRKINVLDLSSSSIYSLERIDSPDMEDCFQIHSAESVWCDVIITNNTHHFKGYTEIPVMTPKEFIEN